MEKTNLENLAYDILDRNDMLKLPVNLSLLAKQNNIDIFTAPLPNKVSGAVRFNHDKNKYEILIDEKEENNNKRNTIAHELAHYFLNGEEIKNGDCSVTYKNNNEENEEYLANAILMHKDILTKLYNLNPSVELLAQTFNVPTSTMTDRLKTLGLM